MDLVFSVALLGQAAQLPSFFEADRHCAKRTSASPVVKASGGYHFHLVNECNAPEDIQRFERPGMMTIKLWGKRYGHEHCMSFVNDLEDPTSAPFFW